MWRGFSLSAGGWALVLGLSVGHLYTCGPFFPNRLLVEGDSFVLEAPVASFAAEVERVKPPVRTRLKAVPTPPTTYGYIGPREYAEHTAAVDAAELEKALRARGVAKLRREAVLRQYRAARKAFTDSITDFAFFHPKPPAFAPPAVPAGIPGEFADYLRGAIHFRQKQTKEARRDWLGLLARPAVSGATAPPGPPS